MFAIVAIKKFGNLLENVVSFALFFDKPVELEYKDLRWEKVEFEYLSFIIMDLEDMNNIKEVSSNDLLTLYFEKQLFGVQGRSITSIYSVYPIELLSMFNTYIDVSSPYNSYSIEIHDFCWDINKIQDINVVAKTVIIKTENLVYNFNLRSSAKSEEEIEKDLITEVLARKVLS